MVNMEFGAKGVVLKKGERKYSLPCILVCLYILKEKGEGNRKK